MPRVISNRYLSVHKFLLSQQLLPSNTSSLHSHGRERKSNCIVTYRTESKSIALKLLTKNEKMKKLNVKFELRSLSCYSDITKKYKKIMGYPFLNTKQNLSLFLFLEITYSFKHSFVFKDWRTQNEYFKILPHLFTCTKIISELFWKYILRLNRSAAVCG